jgi:hypothetical protein
VRVRYGATSYGSLRDKEQNLKGIIPKSSGEQLFILFRKELLYLRSLRLGSACRRTKASNIKKISKALLAIASYSKDDPNISTFPKLDQEIIEIYSSRQIIK